MIRRWSYINNINTLSNKTIFLKTSAASDVILNSLMYLRRDFPVSSKSFRKAWARRKHLNQTLFLTNVMINWAKDYRFYRNYNKMLHYQFFFKNTYLAVNLVTQKGPNYNITRYETAALGSMMTRKLMHFFTCRYQNTRFQPFLWAPASSWTYASYSVPYDESLNSHQGSPYTPLYYIPFKEQMLLPLVNLNEYKNLLNQLFNLLFYITLIKHKEYYSILIKLLLFKL